ncbi:MAG: DUF4388 domain-containing protein [Thermoanaerobaculia bacterium]
MEGTLVDGALVGALRHLQRQRGTGILTVQGEDEIIAFSLLEGAVVSADALNQSLEDGLGEVLIKESLIGGEDFAGLVAEYQAGGGRVTELLLERSFLTREQLLGALRRLTYRLCRLALTWKVGEYRFYRGDDVAYEAGVIPLGVDELLVRSGDDLGSAGPFGSHVAEVRQAYQPILGPGADAALPKEVVEEERPEAEMIYRALDGRKDLSQLADETGISVFTARALVSHWLQCGLVQEAAALPSEVVEVPLAGPIADLGLDALLTEPLDPMGIEESLAEVSAQIPASQPAARHQRPRRMEVAAWPPRVMGLVFFVAVLWVLISAPGRLLLPFPWQGGLRDAFDAEREELSVLKIDRASTVFFLLEGRYPDDLSLLVADRMLQPGAVTDPQGRRFVFSAGPASYVIQIASRELIDDAGRSRAIGGNFLLDPQFLTTEVASEPPLVLLD